MPIFPGKPKSICRVYGLPVPENEHDNYSLAYSQFVVSLVKAVQEQQGMIDQLKKEKTAQDDEIGQLKAELKEIKTLLLEKAN
jgi:hypothetical protein